jgi:hypothetical protein
MNQNKQLFIAILLHYISYIIMQTLAIFAETKRSFGLTDRLHEWISPRRDLDWVNNQVWFFFLLISLLFLILFKKKIAIKYFICGSIVSLTRGIFIFMTSLGAPIAIQNTIPHEIQKFRYEDISISFLLRQWFPLDIFLGNEFSGFYLTQDLFFSGHTASTFLLLLCMEKKDVLYYIFLVYHCNTVFFLIITHEHYTIDILGAYFITYAIFSYINKTQLLDLFSKKMGLN